MHHFISIGEFKCELRSGNAQIWRFFASCDLEILRVTPKNNRAPLICYFKLFGSFRSHWWIFQTGVTVQKRLIWVKIDDFFTRVTLKFDGWPSKANLRDLIAATGLVISNCIQIVNFSARVTVKFDGWPCKTVGHLFYTTASFVHHFVPIGELKLELQTGNAQFGSKSTIFLAVWPRNFTDDPQKQWGTSSVLLQALCIISYPLVNSNLCYSPETPNLGQIWQFLEPCDLEIWWMTLQNNRAPLLQAVCIIS